MKKILYLSLVILLLFLLLQRVADGNGTIVLDENGIEQIEHRALISKLIVIVLAVLNAALSYKLFKQMPRTSGWGKVGVILFCLMSICMSIFFVVIIAIGTTAFWF